MQIKTITDPSIPAEYIAKRILAKLKLGKKILWLMAGGSCISVEVLVAKIISKHPHENLTVTLTDERFGRVGHKDSNWQQLIEKGYSLPNAKLLPVLTGENRTKTVENFNTILQENLKKADYKIGLFGMGNDGHTAGILPRSEAVKASGFAFGYQTANFERITITKQVIEKLDEVVGFMQGKEKWPVIKDLEEKNIGTSIQPAQILKLVPRLTIFTDYKK